MSYRIPNKIAHVYVTYTLEGEGEGKTSENQACYATIFHSQINEKWKSILCHESLEWVVYKEPEVKRWIADLNEIGFPCHFVDMEGTLKIRLVLSEFSSKVHMASTLQLIRCLWENGMNKIPDIYFKAMDANPEADKVEEIQKAHKSDLLIEKKQGYYSWLPEGHMVTYPSNSKDNVSKKALLARLAKGKNVYAGGSLGSSAINNAWRAGRIPKEEYEYE